MSKQSYTYQILGVVITVKNLDMGKIRVLIETFVQSAVAKIILWMGVLKKNVVVLTVRDHIMLIQETALNTNNKIDTENTIY